MTWIIDPEDDDYVCEEHGDQVIVASVVDCGDGNARRRHAHLIAAAPDMLEALERLLLTPGIDNESRDACNAARAAIKKARGES